MDDVRPERVDLQKILAQGFDFSPPDLLDEVLLTVEVGRFDFIEIRQDEPAHARSGQGHRDGRTQASCSGYPDDAPAQNGQNPGIMLGKKRFRQVDHGPPT